MPSSSTTVSPNKRHRPGGSSTMAQPSNSDGAQAASVPSNVSSDGTAAKGETTDIFNFRLQLSEPVSAWLRDRMPAEHLDSILSALHLPRRITSLRVNTLVANRADLVKSLKPPLEAKGFSVVAHPVLPDCIVIQESNASAADVAGVEGMSAIDKTVLVDKACGEALLRGADLFAKGVRGLSNQIRVGDKVRRSLCLGIRNRRIVH